MTNKQLLCCAAIINIIMMLLLVHKQNKIIKKLYEMQQLHEQKSEFEQQQKELILKLHQLTQLSGIQNHAINNLGLKSMTLRDVHKITTAVTQEEADGNIAQ